MRLKQVPIASSSPKRDLLFSGLNRNEFISDNEIKAGTNLSSEYLPALSPRLPREEVYPLARLVDPKYIFSAGGKLCWVDGDVFFYDGVGQGALITGTEVTSMVDFNGRVIIFPSKQYYTYDTAMADYDTFAPMSSEAPDIDFCAQHYNRIFGCKGSNIYASAWGNFNEWNKFEGTDQDSYATDVATEGDFTGAFTFDNHVTLFKDNFVEELYGSLPRNFQLMNMSGFGTISNSAIAEGGGYMLFADGINIYAYTGGRPVSISLPLNEKGYTDIKMASDGRRFYVLVVRSSTSRTLYCYDLDNKCWMPEDSLDIVGFTTLNQKVYALDTSGKIWRFNSGAETVSWSAETKVFDDSLFEKKKVKNVKLRLKMVNGATLSIYSKKNDGAWVLEHTVTNTSGGEEYSVARKVVSVNRANRYQLKFEGTGHTIVYGEREFDIGSQF